MGETHRYVPQYHSIESDGTVKMRVRVVAVECMLGNEDRNLSKSGTVNDALQNTIIELVVSMYVLKTLCLYSSL